MSQQRSGSPNYRSPRRQPLPWDQSDNRSYSRLAEHDMPLDRSHQPRLDREEHGDIYSEGLRRSPSFSDSRHFGRQSHVVPEELYRRRTSPRRDMKGYEEGLRDRFQHFETRGGSPHSPPRLARERLPPTPQLHKDHPQKVSEMDWRRENQGRDRGRSRDLSPRPMLDDQRGVASRDRGRRDEQGLNRDGRRDNSHRQRNYPVKRHRREMDDCAPLGYGIENEFEQHDSQERPRDAFGDGTRGHSGPSVYECEHDRNMSDPPRRQQFDDRTGRNSGFGRKRSPLPMGSLQEERFRRSNSRMDNQEGAGPHSSQDNWKAATYENRGSPVPRNRTNHVQQTDRLHPLPHITNFRRVGSHPKEKVSHGGRTGTGPPRSHPSSQQPHKGYHDHPHEQQIRERAKEFYEDSIRAVPNWTEAGGFQKWANDRPGSQDRHLLKDDLDPKMPRQRARGWNDQQANDMTVVTKETLTIKVDMSRPVNQNSQKCYSSDRQLSLDLVNVGRQRLDFLPMLQHSGTYHETPTHTGTFAQEIITLVHQVKEQYFRDNGVTLNERFSAPQKGYSDGEMEELTLDERFSSTRGFTLNTSTLSDDEPLFFNAGPLQLMGQQPLRGPGDLRHDLERRRQERLEGVKVTIPGNSMSQRPLDPVSDGEQCDEYFEKVEAAEMEGGFSKWSGEQKMRRGGKMGPRRGANYRQNMRLQRRNNHARSHTGPMRRHNNRSNTAVHETMSQTSRPCERRPSSCAERHI